MAAGYGLVPYGEGDWGSENSFVPGTGSLSIQSEAPNVNTGIIPSGGAVIVGSAPVVVIVERIKTPGSESLSLVGAAPTTQIAFSITAGDPQNLSIVGAAPTVIPATSTLITPPSGSITFDHSWGLGSWDGDGGWGAANQFPTLISGTIIVPNTGSLSIVGAAPGRVDGALITPNTGALAVSGIAPFTLTDFRLQPAANDAVISGNVPEIAFSSVSQTFTEKHHLQELPLFLL